MQALHAVRSALGAAAIVAYFMSAHTVCALQYNDHGYLTANQFGDQRRQPIVSISKPGSYLAHALCRGKLIEVSVGSPVKTDTPNRAPRGLGNPVFG